MTDKWHLVSMICFIFIHIYSNNMKVTIKQTWQKKKKKKKNYCKKTCLRHVKRRTQACKTDVVLALPVLPVPPQDGRCRQNVI